MPASVWLTTKFIRTWASSPFRRSGTFSDAPTSADPLAGLTSFPETTRGAFRTPTLRGLPSTGPYGHAGTFTDVRTTVQHYATIRMPVMTPDPHVAGALDPHLVGFDNVPQRVDPITAFLMRL